MDVTEHARTSRDEVKVVIDMAPAAAETPPPPSPNKILQQQRYVAGGRRKRSDVKPGAVAIAGRAVPVRASQQRETLREVCRCNQTNARICKYPKLALRLVCKGALGASRAATTRALCLRRPARSTTTAWGSGRSTSQLCGHENMRTAEQNYACSVPRLLQPLGCLGKTAHGRSREAKMRAA